MLQGHSRLLWLLPVHQNLGRDATQSTVCVFCGASLNLRIVVLSPDSSLVKTSNTSDYLPNGSKHHPHADLNSMFCFIPAARPGCPACRARGTSFRNFNHVEGTALSEKATRCHQKSQQPQNPRIIQAGGLLSTLQVLLILLCNFR